jgi:ferredoxin-thioredoxin reductase catalytic subunit
MDMPVKLSRFTQNPQAQASSHSTKPWYRKFKRFRFRRKYLSYRQHNPEPVSGSKPVLVHEELPDSMFSGLYNHRFQRQLGIEYDPDNPKVSYSKADHESDSGFISELSGVSGIVPGAHRMPAYGHDTSSHDLPPLPSSFGYIRAHHQAVSKPRPSTEVDKRNVQTSGDSGMDSADSGTLDFKMIHGLINLHKKPQDSLHLKLTPNPGRKNYKYLSMPLSRHYMSPSKVFALPLSDADLLTVMNCLLVHNNACEVPDCPCRKIREQYRDIKVSSDRLQRSEQLTTTVRPSHVKLLILLNCLMHSEDCGSVGCPCRQLQSRYKRFQAASFPLQRARSLELKPKANSGDILLRSSELYLNLEGEKDPCSLSLSRIRHNSLPDLTKITSHDGVLDHLRKHSADNEESQRKLYYFPLGTEVTTVNGGITVRTEC